MILFLPATFLLLATIFEAWSRDWQFRDSISDSYQEPVRDVFVGALMASGVCMIAYKGRSKLEDYALNFAGFNAFFVALVPNNFTAVLNRVKSTSVSVGEVATRDQLLTNLRFVLAAFLITAVLFTYFDYKLMNWHALEWGKDETKFAGALAVVSWVTEIIFLVLIVGNVLVGRETFFGGTVFGILHFTAAGLMIGNLSFAAASNAFPATLRNRQQNAEGSRPRPARSAGTASSCSRCGGNHHRRLLYLAPCSVRRDRDRVRRDRHLRRLLARRHPTGLEEPALTVHLSRKVLPVPDAAAGESARQRC